MHQKHPQLFEQFVECNSSSLYLFYFHFIHQLCVYMLEQLLQHTCCIPALLFVTVYQTVCSAGVSEFSPLVAHSRLQLSGILSYLCAVASLTSVSRFNRLWALRSRAFRSSPIVLKLIPSHSTALKTPEHSPLHIKLIFGVHQSDSSIPSKSAFLHILWSILCQIVGRLQRHWLLLSALCQQIICFIILTSQLPCLSSQHPLSRFP